MRWLFASVVVVVAGAVGAFAVYRFSGDSGGSDRSRALIAAHELAGACDGSCHAADVQHVAGDVWKLTLMPNHICLTVHLNTYSPPPIGTSSLFGVPGVARTDC